VSARDKAGRNVGWIRPVRAAIRAALDREDSYHEQATETEIAIRMPNNTGEGS
jgi:hypothetical protein